MVGLLAASSVFAGISFSGEFNFGYGANIQLEDPKTSNVEFSGSPEGKIKISAKDDDGIWSMSISNGGSSILGGIKVKATINFDKLAAKLGADWGSWKFSMVAGNNPNPALATAYNKKVGGLYSASKANALYPMVFSVSDGNWVDLQVGVDPTFGGKNEKGNTVASFLASAKSTPIDGLDLSLGYIFNAGVWDSEKSKFKDGNESFANDIEFGFALDLAKMIGTSFDLIISGGDTFQFGSINNGPVVDFSGNVNNTADVGVYAGIDLINGFAEINIDSKVDPSSTTFGAKAGVASNFGVEGLGFSASVATEDFTKFIDNFTIDAEASYDFSFGLSTTLSASIGGVSKGANKEDLTLTVGGKADYDFGGVGGLSGSVEVKYDYNVDEKPNTISITPKISIKF